MASAILKEIFEIEIIRTRDEDVLKKLDIVYDVGGGEFDHHGKDKVYREDGIPYAACGLIWKSFGRQVIYFNDPSLSEEEIDSIYDYVDKVLIKGIDALDNGVRIIESDIQIMNISTIISAFNPPWYLYKKEEEEFNIAVETTNHILRNTIKRKLSVLKSRVIVEGAYDNRKIKELLLIDRPCSWEEALLDIDEKGEVLFVIYQSDGTYILQTVRGENGDDRKKLPLEWAGKRDSELSEATGVSDAVFCHTGRFLAVAKSFDGAMKMAKLALEGTNRNELDFMSFIKKWLPKY